MSNPEEIPRTNALAGRVALITGAASGIGRATAELFAREGAAVIVADKNRAEGEEVVRAITENSGRAVFVTCEVSRAKECQEAVASAVTQFDRLDILVNSAGIIRRTTVLDIEPDEWDLVMAVNVKSIYLVSRYAIPEMIRTGGGSIINIGSGWGLVGGGRAVSYCASKGAVVNMTRAMAIDHGSQNIRVNCVCPGDTQTPMLVDEAHQLGEEQRSFLASAAERPLGRVGRPEDIAQAALYLSGNASQHVTGSMLVVDGGGLAG